MSDIRQAKWDVSCDVDFRTKDSSAYTVLRRFGVDTLELFENLDSAEYLKGIIKKLANDAIERIGTDV